MKGILQNFSIQKRMLSILMVWMIIFISFGVIAVVRMNQLAKVTQHIYDYPVQVSRAVRETQVNTVKLHREMKDIIISSNEEEIKKHEEIVDNLDKKISDSIQFIKKQTSSEEARTLEGEMEVLLDKWKQGRGEVINLMKNGKIKDAISISKNTNGNYVDQIEQDLNRINQLEGIIASNLMIEAGKIESSQKRILIFLLIILGGIATLFFSLIIRSIIKPIEELKKVMSYNVNADELLDVNIQGNNEIVDMSKHFNALIYKLKDEIWIKNGQNELNKEISGDYSLNELTQRIINYLGRFLEAGNGVFYLYNENENNLYLKASFAFTEKNRLSNVYDVGKGIIGQVALEKKGILLKNVNRQQAMVTTGTVSTAPLNLYAFPLVYEDKLYGVIELSSFEPFTLLKREFLERGSKTIAINLYSVIQNEKIKNLLDESEKANIILEKQQTLLQQQTEELQKTNAELEEQQQLLQQQSGELYQSNAQLEEQQQLLEEQSKTLNMQNTDLKNSREELIKRTKELELTNKYKSEFLANMSHELRTPLNSIILLSKLLITNSKESLSEDSVDKIAIIYDSGKELLRLINDILDLSKIEAGKVDLNITIFHSSELMQHLKNLFEGIAENKRIEFIVEDYVNTVLTGDMDKISQILRNLISNALKFTEEGSVTLKVEEDKKEHNRVIFSIIDTGIGIRYEQLNMIFEEFQQGDGSISRKYGGTGLGLSISKKLAILMNGCIEVESEEKKGSKFILSLPNLIKSFGDMEEVKNLVAFTEEKINSVEKYGKKDNYLISRTDMKYALNLKGKKILIVDDDPRNIFVLASALEEFEAEVFEAENGKDALEKLKETAVDLVLIDMMMPVMDGYEAIKAIRMDEKLKDLPIIALTAKSLKEDKARCISVGADDYISKPVDYDIFVRLVKAWINKRVHKK